MRLYILPILLGYSHSSLGEGKKLCVDRNCEGQIEVAKGNICEGWKFKIEPDMQIIDDDLTTAKVRNSIQWLSENIDKSGFSYGLGKENRLKILRGYVLKQNYAEAETENKNDAKNFYCEWLRDEGFWYD